MWDVSGAGERFINKVPVDKTRKGVKNGGEKRVEFVQYRPFL